MAMDMNLNIDPKNLYLAPLPVKLVLGIIIMVLVLVVGYFFSFQEQIQTHKDKQNQEEQLKDTYKKKAVLAANLPILKKEMEELEKAFQLLVKQLPTEKEVPNIIQQLHSAATTNGLTIKMMRPEGAVPDGNIVRLPYRISTVGTYDQLFTFCKDVGSLSRIIVLDQLKITPQNAKPGQLTFDAVANTYMANESTQQASF